MHLTSDVGGRAAGAPLRLGPEGALLGEVEPLVGQRVRVRVRARARVRARVRVRVTVRVKGWGEGEGEG